MSTPYRYDYVIVDSDIAGLHTALLAREHGNVLVLTKGDIQGSNTHYAQGGIPAAMAIAELVRIGLEFDITQEAMTLAREGAQSAARLLYTGGHTTKSSKLRSCPG